jgi:Na+-driven multidrug efflux pump
MVDNKFYGAGKFILIISMAYCLSGIWKMFVGYLIAAGKTKLYSYVTFIAAFMNILLNYILLKAFGLIGSAWATLISMGFGALLTIYVSTRVYKMPWGFFLAKHRIVL